MDDSAASQQAGLPAEGILSIAAANSQEFLAAVFEAYAAGRLFAITRPDTDLEIYGAPVTPVTHAGETRGWCRFDHRPSDDPAPAQIVFTSGTEGRAKAILLSARNLADVVRRLNDVMQVTEEIREYVGIPVTYSFGLGRIRAVSAAGGACFLPERFDPHEIRRMLEAGEINAISAVPSLWRLVLAAPEAIGAAGEAVRWIEIGSQYMSAEEKQAMKRLFPKARIVQHYGMTEASRSTFLVISGESDPARLESVGPPEGVRLSPGGAICIRGAHVALGRLTEGGGLEPLAGPDGWLESSDRGEIRDGLLYYLGRLDDQMNLGGIKVGAEALEARVAALLPEARGHFALTSVADPMRGETVLLAAEPPADALLPVLTAATQHALSERGVATGGSLRSTRLAELPRTSTGKIRRAALRDLAPADPATAAPGQPQVTALTEPQARIARLWQKVVGPVDIGPGDTFYDTGGDSLSGLQVGILMEGARLPRAAVNATFEGRTLAQVARLAGAAPAEAPETPARAPAEPALTDQARISWSLTLTRAVVVLSVLASHWGHGFFNMLNVPISTYGVLWPYFRMGTPGFAMVFGLGVGLYMLPDMKKRPGAVFHRMDRAFFLVAGGAGLLTLLHLLHDWLLGIPLTGLVISNAIYGVLIYYVIMLGTARLWLPPLARLRAPVETLLILALTSWVLWQVMDEVLPGTQMTSLLELGRLMLSAGYNVFKLSAMMLGGAAVGYWISTQSDPAHIARRLCALGLTGAAFCVAVVMQAEGPYILRINSSIYTSLPGLGFYGSACVLLMGLFMLLLPVWARAGRLLRGVLHLALTVGGLALPVYVFHQFVLPSRDILVVTGLSEQVALAAAMGGFLAIMLYLGCRVYRMYAA